MSRSLLKKKIEEDDSNDRLTYKMHDLIHNLAQSIVGYEVLIPRNATSRVSREVSHVSLLEKLNPMIKDKKKREAYHRVRYIVDGIEKTISLGLGIHIRRN